MSNPCDFCDCLDYRPSSRRAQTCMCGHTKGEHPEMDHTAPAHNSLTTIGRKGSGKSAHVPEVQSAIVWFNGYDRGSPFYDLAIASGGFDAIDEDEQLRLAWPAVVQWSYGDGQMQEWGRRVGIDVIRRCFVVEFADSGRVLINIDAAAAVLEIGRNSVGESQGVQDG